MTSVDNRVVHMEFDNAAFERGVAQTLASLNRLNQGLQLQGAAKGLQGIGREANNQAGSLDKMSENVDTIASRFSAMGVVGTASLVAISQQAIQAGKQLIKSLTIDSVIDGFREYETNLNSIQTILANTQAAGTTLKDVNATLDELNQYSDQTIYNFAEMAKNIGTFTAAGVDLKTSTAAIKGIANLAALSGSNSEQAAGAMYQLSQAISAGRVSLEDWNSVVNAGMGGTVFQRALAQTAEKMGTLDKGAVELKGSMKNVTIEGKSFRESITAKPGQESWLTSDVLTTTLSQFTADLSDAELAAQGFNKAEIKAIQAQAQMAKSAATEVKTLTQLFGTFREQVGSGWAHTWQTIFGDFNEAKSLFTGISETVGGFLQESADARNDMLHDWKELGGRDALIEGLSNAFKALLSFIRPVKEAFRQIFPRTTAKQLYEMTVSFRDFMERLKLGDETAKNLKRTFAGVFALFGIGVDIVKGIVGAIFDLLGVVGEGSGGILEFTARVGDFIVKVRNALKEGEAFQKFFQTIGKILSIPIKIIGALATGIGNLFSEFDGDAILSKVTGFFSLFKGIGEFVDNIVEGGDKVVDVINRIFSGLEPLVSAIGSFFGGIGDAITGAFEGVDFKKVLAVVNTGLFAGLILLVKRFIDNITGAGGDGGLAQLAEGIKETFGQLTDTMKAMQNALNAATLLQIAIAIGILTISVTQLAKVDAEDLGKSLGAIAVMFTQLIGALAVFNKFVGTAGFAKLPFVMGSLILLASAVLILAQAVKQLSGLDWNELAKGLTGLAGVLALIVGSLKVMPNPKGLVSTGAGIVVLALGIKILASAVEDMSGLGWQEIAKGLVGVGALLGALTLFTMFAKANKGGLAQGAGIVLLAAGIKILASAVSDMAKLSWGEIARGLVTLAGSLGIITAALMLIPPTAPLAALGVVGVAASLGLVAESLAKMGAMNWGEIGKGLTAMLGAMTIIAAALYVIPPTAPLAAVGMLGVALALIQIADVLNEFAQYEWGEIGKAMTLLAGTMGIIALAMLAMTGAVPGAVATLIIAGALAVLAPVLLAFSQMSLGEIGTSLLMLAGVFLVFGAAALLLAPVVPIMIGLGAAITLLGLGVLAAGAGVLLFATALTALTAAGAGATAMLVTMIVSVAGTIPEVMKKIGEGIIAFAQVIIDSAPVVVEAIVTVLESLISAIRRLSPKIIDTFLRMLTMLLEKLAQYVPRIVQAGLNILLGFLRGIANNIGKVIDEATRIAVNFINGIARNLPKIIDSGFNLIIKFIQGIRKAIDKNAETLGREGGKMAVAIIKGMVKGIKAGAGEILKAAKGIAGGVIDGVAGFLGIKSPSREFIKIGNYVNDGFVKGLHGNKKQVYRSFDDLKKMLKDLSKNAKASRSERRKATRAYGELTKKLNDERSALGRLANEYDSYTEKIKNANQTLANAIKTRDDYNKKIREQYSDAPSATGETKLTDYLGDLKKQIEDTKLFSNALQRLRAFGLNDETYKDLLAKGTDALPFVNQLLDGGKLSIEELNKLNEELDAAGSHLGKEASNALYQAGVDSAKGLVAGLKKEQAAIEKQMDKIADTMVRSIKRKLGIRSPSRVFRALGEFTAAGMAQGLKDSSGLVAKSAEDVGQDAVDSVRKSISGFSDLITADLDSRPVITPVLDLSGFRRDSERMGQLLPAQGISVDSAYAKARYVRDAHASNLAASSQTDDVSPSGTVNYTQNNYSPKALSSADIYRQTKNQLSTVKGALSTSASTG